MEQDMRIAPQALGVRRATTAMARRVKTQIAASQFSDDLIDDDFESDFDDVEDTETVDEDLSTDDAVSSDFAD